MDKDEKLHSLEMFEIDFLNKLGVDTTNIYLDVETHIEKIFEKIFSGITTLDDLGTSYIEYEEMVGKLEQLNDKIDCATNSLFRMKKMLEKTSSFSTKETLLAYLNDALEDLE